MSHWLNFTTVFEGSIILVFILSLGKHGCSTAVFFFFFRGSTRLHEALQVLVRQIRARSGTDLLITIVFPLKRTEARVLISDKETVIEEVKDGLRLSVDDCIEDVKELRRHADFVLAYKHLEHQFESEWALLIERDMNRGGLLAWRVKPGVAMEEGKRKHVDPDIVRAILPSQTH